MKILTATIAHESNSFSNISTDIDQFKQHRLYDAPEALQKLAGTNTVLGGFLKAARKGEAPRPKGRGFPERKLSVSDSFP